MMIHESDKDWVACNKLSLNVEKPHYVAFATRNEDTLEIEVKINNEYIVRVYHTNFRCVQLEAKLSWKIHIQYIGVTLAKRHHY